ncbi:MAG: ribosome biogenesis factor YjgA [Desulfopila sp.]|jgi:ribosome-associated protein|nr:ribosome biogenesis factor YjgA [Desulfopila sp.]
MIERISRSEQKRLFKLVEELAVELTELTGKDIKKFPASEEIKVEISNCKGLSGGARKRQIKYLAKILRQEESLEEMYQFLQSRKGSLLKENQLFHEAERWRDTIVNEAIERNDRCRSDQIAFEPDYHSALIADALAHFPSLDEMDLRRCTYQYVRTRNKTHYRELFRMIKAAVEMEERKAR